MKDGQLGPADRLEDAFGFRQIPDALFHEMPFGLRFHLSAGVYEHTDYPISVTLQAVDRARRIASAFVAETEGLTLLGTYEAGVEDDVMDRKILRVMRRLGFKDAFGDAQRVPQNDPQHIAEFGEDRYLAIRAVELVPPYSSLDTLVWAAVAVPLQLFPKNRWMMINLVDFSRRAILRIYDDRGIDIVALTPEPLLPLYRKFRSWIMPDNLAAIDKALWPRLNETDDKIVPLRS
jgi:hypothetical protein